MIVLRTKSVQLTLELKQKYGTKELLRDASFVSATAEVSVSRKYLDIEFADFLIQIN